VKGEKGLKRESRKRGGGSVVLPISDVEEVERDFQIEVHF